MEPRHIDRAIDIAAERSHQAPARPELRHGKEAAFEALNERNKTVVEQATILTESAPEVEVTSEQQIYTYHPEYGRLYQGVGPVTEYWKKVVVVMGNAKVSEVTPDHVVLCEVGTIRANPATVESDPSTRASFAFAIVRRDTVDYYLGNPHELHNPRRPGKKLLTPESTRDLGGSIIANTGLRAAHSKRSVYRWSLNGIKTEVETSEKNIAQVMEAASNYDLNPHLFGNEIEEAPEPEPIMPKNLVNIISSVISSGKKKKKQNPIDLDRPLTGQELIELDYRIETEFDLKLAPEELQGVSVVRDLARLVIKMIDPEQETISEIVSQG